MAVDNFSERGHQEPKFGVLGTKIRGIRNLTSQKRLLYQVFSVFF